MSSQQNTEPSLWDQALNAYEEGATDVEVAKLLGVTKKKFLKMYEEVPDFQTFVDKGRTISEAWWHMKLRTNIGNKDFNNALFALAMKNLWQWADRVEQNNTDDKTNTNVEQLREQLRSLAASLEKKNPTLFREIMGEGIH